MIDPRNSNLSLLGVVSVLSVYALQQLTAPAGATSDSYERNHKWIYHGCREESMSIPLTARGISSISIDNHEGEKLCPGFDKFHEKMHPIMF